MSSLVVGGIVIPVAVSSPSFSRSDAADRGRMLDGTYYASQTGGAAREWDFSTPPVTTADATTYSLVLGRVASQLCSGDILELPIMCCSEFTGGTPVRTAVGHRVVLNFRLHEAQPTRALLRYTPGETITGESFTRGSAARYNNSSGAGVVASAATNIKRDAHYVSAVRSILLEDARTNLCLQSENFGTTWSTVGTPTRSAGAHTASGVSLDLIGDDSAGGLEGYYQAGITLTGSVVKAVSIYVKVSTSTRSVIALQDAIAGTYPLRASVTWSAGLPVLATVEGTALGYETLEDGVFRLRFATASVTAANAHQIYVLPATDTAFGSSDTGAVYAGGVQVENNLRPSSYNPTTTATVPRSADLYSIPFSTPPMEMTVYAKFEELGTGHIFAITNAASANPIFMGVASGGSYFANHINAANVDSSVTVGAMGDTVELVFRLFGDGSVDIIKSINGGAAVTGTLSAATPLGSAWGGLLVWLNSSGSSTSGFTALQSFKIISGIRSLIEVRVL